MHIGYYERANKVKEIMSNWCL